MKKALLLCGLVILLATVFWGCSEKDDDNNTATGNPPAMSSLPSLTFTMPAEDHVFDDSWYQTIVYSDTTNVQAISLDHFITKSLTNPLEALTPEDTTDTRGLFTYHLLSSDGFDPRTRGYSDLTWAKMMTGYLIPSKTYRSYFPSTAIETAFDVKHLQTIGLFRTITVVKANGERVMFEISANDTTTVTNYDGNPETAYALKDLISTYITDTPGNYSYKFFDSTMEYSQVYTWAEVQAGYWLKTTCRTVFPSITDMPNSKKKFKRLMEIQLVPVSS